MPEELVVLKGGGDIASGIAHRLYRAGFKLVILETNRPTVIRREVAFAEAIFEEEKVVEGVKARKAGDVDSALKILRYGEIPVLVDPRGLSISLLKPNVVVDAILAKKNLGTKIEDAPVVIGVGPGFTVGRDVHMVVETMRGHNLGKVIEEGSAIPNTGIPGNIAGYSEERVLRAPAEGLFLVRKKIGDLVDQGEVVAEVEGVALKATITGALRGLLREGLDVKKGMKVGDIDPRGIREYCFTISDKSRAVAGGVLEAVLYYKGRIKKDGS